MLKRVISALIVLSTLVLFTGIQSASAEPLIITSANASEQVLPTGQLALVWTCTAQSTIETTEFTTIVHCDVKTTEGATIHGVEPVQAAGPLAAGGGVQIPFATSGSTIQVCQTDRADFLGGSVTETHCDTIPT